MPSDTKTLLSSVNSAGYLFQIAVAQLVKQTQRHHGWEVVAHEHRWQHPVTEEEGFIDLILEKGAFKLVIECKRPRGGHWVFLVPDRRSSTKTRARIYWTQFQPGRNPEGAQTQDALYAWDDFDVAPDSYESAFCIPQGHGDDSRPMLERIAGPLLRSVEALADEYLKRLPLDCAGTICYAPLIVTSVPMWVCRFDPADIDATTGKLPNGHGDFERIDRIRFRKGLPTIMPTGLGGKPTTYIRQINRDDERTVLVVHIDGLASALQMLAASPRGDIWPATLIRHGQTGL